MTGSPLKRSEAVSRLRPSTRNARLDGDADEWLAAADFKFAKSPTFSRKTTGRRSAKSPATAKMVSQQKRRQSVLLKRLDLPVEVSTSPNIRRTRRQSMGPMPRKREVQKDSEKASRLPRAVSDNTVQSKKTSTSMLPPAPKKVSTSRLPPAPKKASPSRLPPTSKKASPSRLPPAPKKVSTSRIPQTPKKKVEEDDIGISTSPQKFYSPIKKQNKNVSPHNIIRGKRTSIAVLPKVEAVVKKTRSKAVSTSVLQENSKKLEIVLSPLSLKTIAKAETPQKQELSKSTKKTGSKVNINTKENTSPSTVVAKKPTEDRKIAKSIASSSLRKDLDKDEYTPAKKLKTKSPESQQKPRLTRSAVRSSQRVRLVATSPAPSKSSFRKTPKSKLKEEVTAPEDLGSSPALSARTQLQMIRVSSPLIQKHRTPSRKLKPFTPRPDPAPSSMLRKNMKKKVAETMVTKVSVEVHRLMDPEICTPRAKLNLADGDAVPQVCPTTPVSMTNLPPTPTSSRKVLSSAVSRRSALRNGGRCVVSPRTLGSTTPRSSTPIHDNTIDTLDASPATTTLSQDPEKDEECGNDDTNDDTSMTEEEKEPEPQQASKRSYCSLM